MKGILPVIILMFSTIIFAQELKDSKWILKVNAAQLVDVVSYPTLQISAERKINPYFSVNAEFGYQLYDFNKADTILLKSKGFKVNLEARLYLFKLLKSRTQSKTSELYVGLQLFHRKNQDTYNLKFISSDNNTLYSDDFGAKKTAHGFNIIIGNQISVSKKLVLEPFIGIGSLYIKTRNSDLEYDEAKHVIDIDGLSSINSRLESKTGNFTNFCWGFRIGYRLQ